MIAVAFPAKDNPSQVVTHLARWCMIWPLSAW